jgi:hypothetical protein
MVRKIVGGRSLTTHWSGRGETGVCSDLQAAHPPPLSSMAFGAYLVGIRLKKEETMPAGCGKCSQRCGAQGVLEKHPLGPHQARWQGLQHAQEVL